jgi:ketosteroid isomerase-like protein
VYEAARRRDAAAVYELYDPGVELDSSRLEIVDSVGAGGDVYRGHDGLRRFFREWHEAWDRVEYDFDDLLDAGDNHVITLVTRRGRGRVSGAEVERQLALVWTLRDARVVRVEWFPTAEEARRAVASED